MAISAELMEKIEDEFERLRSTLSTSLLKKYLVPELFHKIKNRVTPTYKSNILDCIQSGIKNPDSKIGVYAPDPEAYQIFRELFDLIIGDYHCVCLLNIYLQPPREFGNPFYYQNIDPKGEYIKTIKISCVRSINEYPFIPAISEEQLQEIEQTLKEFCETYDGEFRGNYHRWSELDNEMKETLLKENVLFKDYNRFLAAANVYKHWPTGRGIFFNESRTFIVWVNEEDHIRIISKQSGGNVFDAYLRLINGVNKMEEKITFLRDCRLGYLTLSPINIGNTIKASVYMKLPKLGQNKERLKLIAEQLNLKVLSCSEIEDVNCKSELYKIFNKRRLGLSEFDSVKEMYEGVRDLLQFEKICTCQPGCPCPTRRKY